MRTIGTKLVLVFLLFLAVMAKTQTVSQIINGGTGATTAAGAQANLLNPTDQWVAVGADPVATINAACAYIAANNQSVRLNFPGSRFVFGSTAMIGNTCSGLTINGTQGILAPTCANPDTCMNVQGGTVFDCGASQCILINGNGTTGPNNVTIQNVLFDDWGATGFLQSGSPTTVGAGFPRFKDIYAVGQTTVNASTLGMVLYNTQHATIDELRIANVDTGFSTLVAGSTGSIPGNSEIHSLYVYPYTKSVANGNCSYPAIDNEANYNVFYYVQVNQYTGESCSTAIYDNTSLTTYDAVAFEGNFLNGMDIAGGDEIINIVDAFGRPSTINDVTMESSSGEIQLTSSSPNVTINNQSANNTRNWFSGSFNSTFPWVFLTASGGSGMTIGAYPISFSGGGCTTQPTATLYVHSATTYDYPQLLTPGVNCTSASSASVVTGGTPPTLTVHWSQQAYGIFNGQLNVSGGLTLNGTLNALGPDGLNVFGSYIAGGSSNGASAQIKIEGIPTPSAAPYDPGVLICPNGSDSYCGSILQDYFSETGGTNNISGMNFHLGTVSGYRDNATFLNGAGNPVGGFYDTGFLSPYVPSFDSTHNFLMGSGEGIGFWNNTYTAILTPPSYSSNLTWAMPNATGTVMVSGNATTGNLADWTNSGVGSGYYPAWNTGTSKWTATPFPAQPLTGTTGTLTGTSLTSTCDSGTATVTGAVVGSPVVVSSTTGADVGGAFYLRASVTSTNTVTVYVCGTGTPPSLAYNVTVL